VSAQVWLEDPVRALPSGKWHTVTCTLSNGSARLFDNSVESAQVDGVAGKVDDLIALMTTNAAGARFQGKMRRLTVWNRVLTAQEVLAVQHR
jgi:hypothetical protein